MKFPHDAQLLRVLHTLEVLGFDVVRSGPHISLARQNKDGSKTSMTIPAHRTLKSSTLRTICTQVGISRDEFLTAWFRIR